VVYDSTLIVATESTLPTTCVVPVLKSVCSDIWCTNAGMHSDKNATADMICTTHDERKHSSRSFSIAPIRGSGSGSVEVGGAVSFSFPLSF